MNTIKKYILLHLLLLLCQQNCNAMDDDEEMIKEICLVGATGIAAKAYKLSGFGILTAMKTPFTIKAIHSEATDNTKDHLVETNYPYAKLWYDNLAKKHPEASFEKSKFLLHTQTLNGSGASAGMHKICLNQNDVSNLNTSYEKKSSCTAYEEEKMSELEWILLHEACHIKNNDCINNQALALGAAAGSEALYQLHKKKTPVIPTPTAKWPSQLYSATKRIPKRIGVFTGMATLAAVPAHSYMSRAERKADDFAIQHADMNALRAGANFFKKHHDEQQSLIDNQPDNEFAKAAITMHEFFDTHPPLLSRVANIEAEITRREQKLKKGYSK